MPQDKVFIYLIRPSRTGQELLVLDSHDEPGFEVPKGSVEDGESLQDAVRRELFEETGISGIEIRRKLGNDRWLDECQHFYLAGVRCQLPDRFSHTVTGQGGDAGLRYILHWLPVNLDLKGCLVQGCGRFVDALLEVLLLESAKP